MEELSLTLGRVTYRHRVRLSEIHIASSFSSRRLSPPRRISNLFQDADLHIGNNPTISRQHARIEYDWDAAAYRIVNLSRNGISVRHASKVYTVRDGRGE
jgi:hypothetical protein